MKKAFTLLIASMLCVFMFAGCGGDNSNEASPSASPDVIAPSGETPPTAPTGGTPDEDLITITVGASPAPHAEMLELIKDDLLERGIKLEIKEFSDYVMPNTALDENELDANFFQHLHYLDLFNEEHGTKLVAMANVHYEPMCVYGGKSTDFKNIKDGATIAVPNDGTNEARALNILQDEGLIKIKEGAGLDATVKDITDNPKNLDIKELDAAQLPLSLPDVDFAVINGNFAISNDLSMDDALAVEALDKAPSFVNALVVREGDESRQELQILADALCSDKVKAFLEEKYDGAVVPVFGEEETAEPTNGDGNKSTDTPTHPSDEADDSDQPTHPSQEATPDNNQPTHPSETETDGTDPTSPDEE